MLPFKKGKRFLNFTLKKEDHFGVKNTAQLNSKYFLFALLSIGLLYIYQHQTYVSPVVYSNTIAIAATLLSFILLMQMGRTKKKRKSTGNSVKAEELKFSKIYNSTIIGLLFTRLDGRVTQANDTFLKMIGYTRQDLEHGLVNWVEITPPAFQETTQNAIGQVKQNGFCEPFEKEYIRKDGKRIHVLLGSSRLGDDDESEAVSYIIDITDKKQSEEREIQLNKQLNHQQKDLIRIFMNAPAMISIRRGPELKLEFANKAALDFSQTDTHMGLSADAAREKFKLSNRDKIIEHVYHTGQPFTAKALPVKFNLNGGELIERWLDLLIEPIYNNEGEIDGTFSFGFDVTELVKGTSELQKSEARFRFLADTIPHKMWTSAPDGTATYYNQGWYSYTGITGLENLRSQIWELIHPDDRETAVLQWSKAIKSGEQMDIEQRFRRHDGVYRWHLSRVCAHKDQDGKITLWVGTSTDIHEQKVAQEALQVSEAHFKALTNNNSLPIWQVDENCNMVFVNDTWRKYTGVTTAQITDLDWSNNIHPDDLKQKLHDFADLFKKRLPFQQKYRLRNAIDGEYRWMLDNAQPVFNPEFSGYIGSITDIHEQEQGQLAIKLLMEKKDEFMSIASHELKTPITSMKASLQILDRMTLEQLDVPKVQAFVSMANRQANKLTAIVNDLLDVTRIQSGKMELTITNYNFLESLEECIREIMQYEILHNIIIQSSGPVFVYADKIHIEQVIENFVSNAIKYSPAGTDIKILVESNELEVKCSVIDTGIGIPQDKHAFIFDRFFRVHDSSKTYAGLGLGLYISAEIIKQHQGTVGMHSEEGKGSNFWFSLPLKG